MSGRPTDEIIALWTAVFGEPPIIRTDVTAMILVLVSSLPEAPAYDADAVDHVNRTPPRLSIPSALGKHQ